MMMTDEKNDDDRDDDDGNKTFLKRSFQVKSSNCRCIIDWSVRVLFPRYSPSYWENITISQLVTYFDFHIF